MADLKVIELIVNDEDEDVISAMGFVMFPAIEENFIYFNDDKHNYVFGVEDKEQGIIVSPAMIAEKRIYRYDETTNEEYKVFFSAETISKLSQKFLISNNFRNNTLQHERPINDIDLIYSWIVMNENDSIMSHYGFKNIPKGSWVVAYKINNEKIKEQIKSGEIRGISIEGYLTEKYSKLLNNDEQMLNDIKDLLKNS